MPSNSVHKQHQAVTRASNSHTLKLEGAPLTWCSHYRNPRGPRDVWGLETTRMGGYSDRWWRRASCVQFSGIGWRSCERKTWKKNPSNVHPSARWWFQIFIWLIFFRWVESTNQNAAFVIVFLFIAISRFTSVFCLSNSCVSEGSWMSGNGEVWYRAAVAGTFWVSLINLIQPRSSHKNCLVRESGPQNGRNIQL